MWAAGCVWLRLLIVYWWLHVCELGVCHTHTHCPQMHRCTGFTLKRPPVNVYWHVLRLRLQLHRSCLLFVNRMLRVWAFMGRSEPFRNVAKQPVTLTSSLLSWDIQYDPERRLTRHILARCGLISGSRWLRGDDSWIMPYAENLYKHRKTNSIEQLFDFITELADRAHEARISGVSVFPLPFYRIRLGKKQLWELH